MALALVVALYAAADRFAGGFPLHQVGADLPTPEVQAWAAMWWVLGAAAVLALARALFLAIDEARVAALWASGSDRAWMGGCAALAFVLASAVCWGALGGRHIVLDESAYLFMARLIGTGRLYAESPPDAPFYDRGFMINDGKLFAQYFVGWPAMLAPFARLGLEQWANPVWFAASVPAVFGVLKRLVGSPWARLGAVLFATAPFAVFGAATQMAHVACLFWLVWAAWFAIRASDGGAPAWAAAGLALAFSGAFFVRPTTAIGIGGPLVLWWLFAGRRDARALIAFALTGAALGGAFLLVNDAQTGDALKVAYTRYHEYSRESRFLQDVPEEAGVFDFRQTWRVLTGPLEALFRLNQALLGWPCSFVFVPFATRSPGGRLFLASALGMLGVHLFVQDPGIMAYGPVHYLELVGPIVILTVLGVRGLTQIATPEWTARAVLSVLAALVIASFAAYWPWRVQNLARIGRATAIPYLLVEDLPQSVVFVVHGRWLPHCADEQVHAFHVARPDNPPDLDARVLWVNHVSVRHDQAFLARNYPDRPGYVLDWGSDEECQPRLIPLSRLGPGDYPSAFRAPGLAAFDELMGLK